MICLTCSKVTSNPRFCSRSCSVTYNNRLRIVRPDTRIKTSATLTNNSYPSCNIEYSTCVTCGKLYVKHKNRKAACSRKCAATRKPTAEERRKKSEHMKRKFRLNPELHPNRLCAGIKESYPERMLREYLESVGLQRGLDFVIQYNVDSYYVDFYFPKLNLAIEVDGGRWHDKTNPREIKRQKHIESKMKLIRFDAYKLVKKKYENEINGVIAQLAER